MILKHQTITPLPNDKPDAVPELWNSRYREIDENFQGLDVQVEAAKATVADYGKRIGSIENQSASSVAQALRLDWLYRDLQIELELFFDSWTLLDPMTNVVTDAVAGDDSMDLDSVAGIVPGKEYVVFDGNNQESVIITGILSATRVRISSNMGHSYTNALLRRTSWTVTDGKAVATNGGIYLAGPVNMGDENSDKTVVIRQDAKDAVVALYFKDATHVAWTRVYWSWEREIEPGVVDLEYLIPARGKFDIKIVSSRGESGIDPAIYHIACVDNATGLRGIHHPPLTPSIVYPLSGAIDTDEQPSLTTTAYLHPCGTRPSGSDFQICSNGDFAEKNIIVKSGIVDGVSYSPAKKVLAVNTMYYTRARHVDVFGGISEWSDKVSFRTKKNFVTVCKPTGVTPAVGEELKTPDGITLISSAFSTEGGEDTHTQSQWQIASDPGFTSIVYDSGVTGADLINHIVPDGTIPRGNTYYWRVRHQGVDEGWSDWSINAVFSISAVTILQGGSMIGSAGKIDADGMGILWDTKGAYSFKMPSGVSLVSAVCVGDGAGRQENSYFIDENTVCGQGSSAATPGGFKGEGGGSGGRGGGVDGRDEGNSGGGGGAGGYTGEGGSGGSGLHVNGMSGSGGGGVGLYGQGDSGKGGERRGHTGNGGGGGGGGGYYSGTFPGSGGSNGTDGQKGSGSTIGGIGGNYGGGTGGKGTNHLGQGGGGLGWRNNIPVIEGQTYAVKVGGNGAVRIMWGPKGERSFPNDAALFEW
jgi:hypothetical protein